MKYILVQDICHCEDYPCCGHSDEPYPLKEDRARALAGKDEVRLIAYYDPLSERLTPLDEDRIENFEEHRELIEDFLKVCEKYPAPLEYRSKEYRAIESATMKAIDEMDAEEAFEIASEVLRIAKSRPEIQEHAEIFSDTVQECDWSNDCFY